MAQHNAIIVGISGVSSSGKTTLARLLRDVFPNTFVLHEDDFYKTDAEIPINHAAGDVADWDCLEAINLPAFEEALMYIQRHGMPPPNLISKEDKNQVGKVDIDKKIIDELEWQASKWMFRDVPPVAIIDGFLMYSEGMRAVRDLIDVKLFLHTDSQTGKARREARNGYVTIEGFWEDPEGYWENVVWPNYVKEHAFMFENGNVEGEFKQEVLDGLDIKALPAGSSRDMTSMLQWAFDRVSEGLEPKTPRR